VFSSVLEDSQGNYIAVGYIDENTIYRPLFNWMKNGDAWIVKFDSNGNIIWEKTLGGRNADLFRSIVVDEEGNYIVAGFTASEDYDDADRYHSLVALTSDALLVKFDSKGNIVWDRIIGGSNTDSFESVIVNFYGNYVSVGYSNSGDFDVTDGNNGSLDGFIWGEAAD